MATSIQMSDKLRDFLANRKLYNKETYEEVIWDLVEDSLELSEQTINRIKETEKDIIEGKVYTHNEIKKELGI